MYIIVLDNEAGKVEEAFVEYLEKNIAEFETIDELVVKEEDVDKEEINSIKKLLAVMIRKLLVATMEKLLVKKKMIAMKQSYK